MTRDVPSQPPDPAVQLHFIEHAYSQDRTNWLMPNRACTEAMRRSSGFRTERPPEPKVYFCRAVPLTVPADASHSVYPVRTAHGQL